MNQPTPEQLDEATSRRLARLGQQPAATDRLERRLDDAFAAFGADNGQVASQPSQERPSILYQWVRPAAAIAAVLVVALTLVIAVSTPSQPASATAIELSQLHHELVEGSLPLVPVRTINEANAWIASQNASAPALPGNLAGTRVQSCCLVDVQGELAAVAVLNDGRGVVTLVVAEAPDFAHEMGTVIEIDGRRFFGHELNGVRMMMANDGDRWLCVMGDRSEEELAAIASGVEF